MSIFIEHFEVGGDVPFVIAELSGNHRQDINIAYKMVDAALVAGAHAIKLQTYTADSMTLDLASSEFTINEPDSLWFGEKLHTLYAKAATPYEWHKPLFEYIRNKGGIAFSSPFDEDAVDFLDGLNVPCFKIASFELTDLPLIAKAASKGKPLIMSTGMASLSEIEEAVDTARQHGCQDIILLKCTSTYPASEENTNLNTIPHLRSAFDVQVGLSDHTQGIGAAIGAVTLGASVIEKHFVLDRSLGGVDAEFSLEPDELAALVIECKRVKKALGRVQYGGVHDEQKAKKYRRSIYVSRDVKHGELITTQHIKIVRPAFGLAPKHKETVIGMTATQDIKAGTPLSWQLLSHS
ncbi:MAG: pseudaminic acid synthase [Aestuariibacter sp.]